MTKPIILTPEQRQIAMQRCLRAKIVFALWRMIRDIRINFPHLGARRP